MTTQIVAPIGQNAHTNAVQLNGVPVTATSLSRAQLLAAHGELLVETQRYIALLPFHFALFNQVTLKYINGDFDGEEFDRQVAIILGDNPLLEEWLNMPRVTGYAVDNLRAALAMRN